MTFFVPFLFCTFLPPLPVHGGRQPGPSPPEPGCPSPLVGEGGDRRGRRQGDTVPALKVREWSKNYFWYIVYILQCLSISGRNWFNTVYAGRWNRHFFKVSKNAKTFGANWMKQGWYILSCTLSCIFLRGFLHRDVTSKNILLRRRQGSSPSFLAVLGDFGLACSMPRSGQERLAQVSSCYCC